MKSGREHLQQQKTKQIKTKKPTQPPTIPAIGRGALEVLRSAKADFISSDGDDGLRVGEAVGGGKSTIVAEPLVVTVDKEGEDD